MFVSHGRFLFILGRTKKRTNCAAQCKAVANILPPLTNRVVGKKNKTICIALLLWYL